ncbi:MAG: RNA polymerase sigma factor, partial [Trebonia sp.]
MSDSEIVASIVAGDPEGLAAAYDSYAGDLFGYCQSLLQDPNDAADAVQDTFVIAVSKLARLRDPERLRAWLFAVARNECLHRLKSRHAAAPLHEVPEPADDGVDVGRAAERAETIALVRAAAGGLNDRDRDLINQLWHGLDVPEVAAILGVSRDHAYALFSRARDQLEASVGVLLVGRAGRRDCPTLDRLLGDWDGRLTALLRKRMARHIDRCPVCSDRRRRELTPALLYSLTPGALLAMAGLRKIAALASGQPGAPLSAVRDALTRPAAGPAAPATTYGEVTGRSTHSFGISGFPRPPHHGFLGYARRPHLPLAALGAAAIAAGVVVVAVVVLPHPPPTPGQPGRGLTLGGPVPGEAPVVPGGATGSDSPRPPDGAPAG